MVLTSSKSIKRYSASAPGSLMFMGEHAVLNEKKAIVLAIDKRIKVTLTPRTDRTVLIESSLGKIQFPLDAVEENKHTIDLQKRFQFVMGAIEFLKNKLQNGFELTIVSEFSEQVGLGSSAAVTVATLAVLNAMIHDRMRLINKDNHYNLQSQPQLQPQLQSQSQPDPDQAFLYYLFTEAKTVIKAVQGVGSGADAAASVYGGAVVYQEKAPSILQRLSHLPPIVVRYSGYKTPTPIVVEEVRARQKQQPKHYEDLFAAMEVCVTDAVPAIEQKDWHRLGKIATVHQELMNAIGVSTPELDQLVEEMNRTPGILGAKISGSGLGDCVLGIGKPLSGKMPNKIPDKKLDYPEYKDARDVLVSPSLEGVVYE